MPVPQFGEFAMFGTDSTFTIQGAVKEGGSTATTNRFSGSNHLIGQSTASLFDEDYVVGTVDLNKTIISSSQQYRGYPLSLSFDFSLKCAFSESKTIPDPIPDPDESGSVVVVEDLNGDGTEVGFDFTTGGGNITGSGGNGDDTFPASSSYDLVRLSCRFTEIPSLNTSLDFLSLVITTGSDNLQFPNDGLFTSITFSSSAGEDTLQYCDLYDSGSYGNGLYRYRWRSNAACNHFTSGSNLVVSFDTASIDYFTDCDPALTTTQVTITNTSGEVYQNRQVACDSDTITYKYIESSDLTNGLTIGDTVYNTSDGREEFNGNSKYFGINTSSAPTLNVSPDKIVQISSAGNIINITDCIPTPPYEPDLDPASRDCNSTAANPSGVIRNGTYSFSAGEYDVHQIGGSSEVTQSLLWSSYDRPNKFTLYDDSSTFANPIYTTGWVGKSTYANAAGKDQWSVPLDTNTSGSQTIKWGSTTGRKVRVDYGYNNGTLADIAVFSLVCTSSLQPLTVATGSTFSSACQESLSSDIHYHFHTTGSGDFSTLLNGMAIDGIHHIGRVFEDNTGLSPVLKENGKYFSYTSSAGTRYVYTVLDNYIMGLGEDWNMGIISYHQQCPGTKIAGIYMGASGEDCDDSIPTLSTNLVYVKSDWSGFVEQTNINSSSYGDLVIDNTNFSAGDEIILEIYDHDHDGTNIDPKSRTNLSADVSNTDNATTYLVERTSLLDQSSGASKILATVEKDDARTPTTTIKFSPCDGYGDCTVFETSNGFYASSFSGNNPATAGMCTNTFTSTLYIEMAGLQPQTGEKPSLTCGGGTINNPNTYFTIRNSVVGTFIIKMNSDSSAIEQVWTCTGANAPSTGSNTWYLSSGGENSPGDFCGVGEEDNAWDEFTSDAPSWSGGIGYSVYNDLGAIHNGGSKWYRLSDKTLPPNGQQLEPDSYDAPTAGTVEYYWKISSTGTITHKVSSTCSS